jgi:peptidyl-prolyl cis-trans isomerase A (cyclophilin A)
MHQNWSILFKAVACALVTCHLGFGQDPGTADTSAKVLDAGAENPALFDPKLANKTAPDKFRVKIETTKGVMIVEVDRSWSPNGADRFYNLVDIGYFKDIAIFRAIKGFMFQFGIHGNPNVSKVWKESNIKDDPRVPSVSNQVGYLTFAKAGFPDSRSTQFFVNLGNNKMLDPQGFTPIGKIVEGTEILTKIETKYDENSREVQGRFQSEGNAFISKKYPDIDYVKSITLINE